MREVVVKEIKKPVFKKKPILIEGLPGFGQVGRVASEHLIQELKAKKFGEILSPSFPPEVFVDHDGLIHNIKNELYYDTKNSLIILIGDSQASDIRGQHELVGAILKLCKKYKVKEIITLGGYATGTLKEKPQVFGAATSQKLIKKYSEHGIKFKVKSDRGGIVGVSGLLLGMGSAHGIDGVCLMGETPGHPLFVDAKSAEAVVLKLGRALGINISTQELKKRVVEIEKFRTTIQQMMMKAMQQPKEESENELRYIG